MSTNEILDLKNVPCPTNAARAMLKISSMDEGETIELIVDNGEPLTNVKNAIEEEGHEIIQKRESEETTSLIVLVKF